MIRTGLRRHIGSRVVVSTQAVTLRGTLAAASAGWIEIKNAEAFDQITGSAKADGIMLVREDAIAYIQALPEE